MTAGSRTFRGSSGWRLDIAAHIAKPYRKKLGFAEDSGSRIRGFPRCYRTEVLDEDSQEDSPDSSSLRLHGPALLVPHAAESSVRHAEALLSRRMAGRRCLPIGPEDRQLLRQCLPNLRPVLLLHPAQRFGPVLLGVRARFYRCRHSGRRFSRKAAAPSATSSSGSSSSL
jgi:hypothetical protein